MRCWFTPRSRNFTPSCGGVPSGCPGGRRRTRARPRLRAASAAPPTSCNTRVTRFLAGIRHRRRLSYEGPARSGSSTPGCAQQITLVLLVWGHLLFGWHFWLRLKPWIRRPARLRHRLRPGADAGPAGLCARRDQAGSAGSGCPGHREGRAREGQAGRPRGGSPATLSEGRRGVVLSCPLSGPGLAVVLIRPAFTARASPCAIPAAPWRGGGRACPSWKSAAPPHGRICRYAEDGRAVRPAG